MQVSTSVAGGPNHREIESHPVFPAGHMVLFSLGDGAVFPVGDVE